MNQLLDLSTMDPETRVRLINTAVILLFLGVARWGALRVVRAQVREPEARYRWRKGITYAAVVLGIFLVGRIWSTALRQLGTFLGLLTAALAIALRDPVTNVAGWLFIVWRRPFRVGDRIQIGSVTGDVSDLRLFQFSVLEIGQWVHGDQPTGRIVHVPNGRVFSEPQVNYTSEFPFIWNELPVTLTFESNWQLAKALFEEIIGRHGLRESDAVAWLESTSHAITRLAASPAVITSVADNGVVLTLRYLCHPRQRRATAEQIWEDVLRAVGASDDIDFAYPTTRLYNNRREGKPGTGGPAGAGVGE